MSTMVIRSLYRPTWLEPICVLLFFTLIHCSPSEEGGLSGTGSGTKGQMNKDNTDSGDGTDWDSSVFSPDTGDRFEFVEPPAKIEDAGCATSSYVAEKVVETQVEVVEQPVSIYMMLDISTSMSSNNKWIEAGNSIVAFINDPLSAGLNVAIQYFPMPTNPNPNCLVCQGYDIPAAPMAELPGNISAIETSWANLSFQRGTPIECAIRGLTNFCTQYGPQNPDKQCVAVLITDGSPTVCSQDTNLLSSIARDAGVTMYAVGMEGADFGVLETLAQAAGTDCTPNDPATVACNVSQGMTLQEAMNAIRETERVETEIITDAPLDCEWVLPETPKDEVFDKDRVNVQLSEPNKEPFLIPKMEQGEGDCATHPDGWYYDDEANPIPGQSRIIVCDSTCNRIKNIQDAKVDIVLGCKTEVP